MVRQARVLAQATSDLVNAMRSDAEAEIDVDNSKKLLAAAKLLADATARMVEAAKVWKLKQDTKSAFTVLKKYLDYAKISYHEIMFVLTGTMTISTK